MTPVPRRSGAVVLGITGLAASMLTSCSSEKPVEYAGVCVDQRTQQRLDDDECDERQHHHGGGAGYLAAWYFMRNGSRVPGVGSRVTGGSTTPPSSSSFVKGGVPASGVSSLDSSKVTGGQKTIKRGGFGSGFKGGGG